MKYTIFLLVFFTSPLFSQSWGPIKPYLEDEGVYTIEEVRSFAMESTLLSKHYREDMVYAINRGLAEAGESLRITEDNILWVFENTTYEFASWDSYINTESNGVDIRFKNSKKPWSGLAGTFHFGKCKIRYFKAQCVNLTIVPPIIVVDYSPPPQNPIIEEREEPKTIGNTYIINNIINNIIVPQSIPPQPQPVFMPSFQPVFSNPQPLFLNPIPVFQQPVFCPQPRFCPPAISCPPKISTKVCAPRC